VHAVEHLPRLATGKVDYPAVLALSEPGARRSVLPGLPPDQREVISAGGPDSVRQIFEDTLERGEIADGDTFVSLGGDSLSYVAASVRLEQALGHLPPDWHVTPVRDLEHTADVPARKLRRFFAPLETSIVLRAVSIVLIVSTHVGFFSWQGTAHVLMAVAGYNFARFQLSGERLARLRRQLASLARVVIPSMAFIGVAYLLTDRYSLANVVLLNAIIGPEAVTTQWHFWFIEILVYLSSGNDSPARSSLG
jgi:acyl carrier protein